MTIGFPSLDCQLMVISFLCCYFPKLLLSKTGLFSLAPTKSDKRKIRCTGWYFFFDLSKNDPTLNAISLSFATHCGTGPIFIFHPPNPNKLKQPAHVWLGTGRSNFAYLKKALNKAYFHAPICFIGKKNELCGLK